MATTIRAMRPRDYDPVLAIARSLGDWFQPVDQMALAMDVQVHDGLVLVEGHQIRAFLTFHRLDERHAELSWFGVAPQARGSGLGSRLLAALETRLRDEGIRVLQLSTVPADHDATFDPTNRFYLNHGFTVVSRESDFYGMGRPRFLLEKQL